MDVLADTAGNGSNNISLPLRLENFSGKILSRIASYLDESRVLLAVALSAPSESWEICGWNKQPSRASKAIMSAQYHRSLKRTYTRKWDDMGSLLHDNKTLCSRMNDGDLCGVLVCIDAKNILRTFDYYGNHDNITGTGLAPLQNSTTLELIDLSQAHNLSEDAALPILHSILRQDECCLNLLQLPKAWRKRKSEALVSFMADYSEVLNKCFLECTSCYKMCHGTDESPWFIQQCGERYGLQNMTCWSCHKHFCYECSWLDSKGLDYCPSCDRTLCYDCMGKDKCSKCDVTKCWTCLGCWVCDICEIVVCKDCPGRQTVNRCGCCERWICEGCVPFNQCQVPGNCGQMCRANCNECAVSRGGVGRCKVCNESYCGDCKAMEHCFDMGDICTDCHSEIHDVEECYWRSMSPKLKELMADFVLETDMKDDIAIELWRVCIEEFPPDKKFDASTYRNILFGERSSNILAAMFLQEGEDTKAMCILLYGSLIKEIKKRGANYVKAVFQQTPKPTLKSLSMQFRSLAVTYFFQTSSRDKMVEYLRKVGNREIDILCNTELSQSPMHSMEALSTAEYLKAISSKKCENSAEITLLMPSVVYPVGDYCLDTTLGWLLKYNEIHYNFVRHELGVTEDKARFLRVVHQGLNSSEESTLFLSSSGKKTLLQLGINHNSTIAFGKAEAEEAVKNASETKVVTNTVPKKSKKKKCGPKKKNKSKPASIPSLSEEQLIKKYKQEHSKSMNPVFDELDPLLKDTRNRLNDLTLQKSAPKVRRRKNDEENDGSETEPLSLASDDTLCGKAGKSVYHVLVGDGSNLYKTRKHLCRAPLVLDLHGCTQDEALAQLDTGLQVWFDTAMKGQYPWVIPVNIVCGGGAQILSEVVKNWIRTTPQVANRPKSSG